ncbi:MAG: GTP-binding protein [Phycisphaerae bacterium]|nr:GTP-binding protein [Phycisphaerae bacterium]
MPAPERVRAALATGALPGAIAIIVVEGSPDPLDRALRSITGGSTSTAVGEVRLRSLAGVDEGIVARPSDHAVWLMPHGGSRIIARLREALVAAGVEWRDHASIDPASAWPEAADEVERAMLAMLATAASPLAVPFLLDQPRRWRGHVPGEFLDAERGGRLRRLLDPPRVALVGPPNAGKSTLTNALAGREVAIAHDEPGTTRDFTSTRIDLAGLVVEWLDCPGLRDAEDPIERAAIEIADSAIATADLVVLLAGPGQRWSTPRIDPRAAVLRVRSKSDLGGGDAVEDEVEDEGGIEEDLSISVRTRAGLEELVTRARDSLVWPADLADPRPWRWWTERSSTSAR